MSRVYGWTRYGSNPLVHIVTGECETKPYNGRPRRETFWACRPTAYTGRCQAETADAIPEGLTLCSHCELTTTVAPRGTEVVYVLRVDDEIKVGWTKDLPTRASLLHGRVLAYRKGGRPLEQEALRRLAPIVSRGAEWFPADRVDEITRAVMSSEVAA